MTKTLALMLVAGILSGCNSSRASEPMHANISPVLIELFTSEGCSSCPPADALLAQLDRANGSSAAPAVVLSEHVDYWNHDGWKDPYSSSQFTDRQSAYASHFRLDGPYTPQMVVDGTAEFVGSSERTARQSIEKAGSTPKIPLTISGVSITDGNVLTAHIEAGAWPDSVTASSAEVFVAVALNHAESQVLHGENEGRRLSHVAVVQSLNKIGSVEKGKGFAQDVQVKLAPGVDASNLRVVAFVQKSGFGPVLGVALQQARK